MTRVPALAITSAMVVGSLCVLWLGAAYALPGMLAGAGIGVALERWLDGKGAR